MPSPRLRLAFITCVLFAVACGGGGGGSGDGFAAITSETAPGIAAAVFTGVSLSQDASGLVLAALPAPQPPPEMQAAKLGTPTRSAARAPDFATRDSFGPDKVDCTLGGWVTFSGDVADPAAYTAGDLVISDFDLCDEGALGLFDGLLENNIMSIAGDIMAAFEASFDLTVTDLSATIDGNTFVFDGDGMLDIDTMVPDITETNMAGAVLAIAEDADVVTLLDYTTSGMVDTRLNPEEYTLGGAGRATSSSFPGEVTYLVTQDFAGMGDGFPESGIMEITGASGAKIWVIAQNATDVDLLIDLNGDGNEDALVSTTWDAL
jgi:hypothetical protein